MDLLIGYERQVDYIDLYTLTITPDNMKPTLIYFKSVDSLVAMIHILQMHKSHETPAIMLRFVRLNMTQKQQIIQLLQEVMAA